MIWRNMRKYFVIAVLVAIVFCGCRNRAVESEPAAALPETLLYGMPGSYDILLVRRGFSIGYSHEMRQAMWVSYMLTANNLKAKKVRRTNTFKPDPAIKFRPVRPKDYNRTGYDRGHLAPAADMSYSVETMQHSFFMSNISPQLPGCNRGIWKRLEKQVRQWALKEEKLFIVTGPVFSNQKINMMKGSDIPVPDAFYKVVYDMTPPEKMIAFVVPNSSSRKWLASFVVPVDLVEKLTGNDFFSELDDKKEALLEMNSDFQAWHGMKRKR